MINILGWLAHLQIEHTDKVIIGSLLLSGFLVAGIPKVEIQTDFQEGLPQDLPPIVAEEEVQAKFGNTETLTILFQTDETPQEDGYVTDVRDPRMVSSMNFLEDQLQQEPIVESVNSMASLFEQDPSTKQQVKNRLSRTPVEYVNRDYTSTLMFVQLSEEMNERNIQKATNVIEENLRQTPSYPGVEQSVTGLPAIRTALSNVIVTDTTKIIGGSSALILLLLIGARGFFYGPATFVPLFLGLLWTLGTMGWIGLPLTIVTIALSSVLLGLGVEYGSFIAERIVEESEKETVEEAVKESMPSTGKAVLGSSTTDLVGFLALLTAPISFLRDLGLTLAIGESLTLLAAIGLTPALIIRYKRWKR